MAWQIANLSKSCSVSLFKLLNKSVIQLIKTKIFFYTLIMNFYHFAFRETSMQRLAIIKLPPVVNLNATNNSASLLELFVSSTGGQQAREAFARINCNDEAVAHWHWSLLPILDHVKHIMYPLYTV